MATYENQPQGLKYDIADYGEAFLDDFDRPETVMFRTDKGINQFNLKQLGEGLGYTGDEARYWGIKEFEKKFGLGLSDIKDRQKNFKQQNLADMYQASMQQFQPANFDDFQSKYVKKYSNFDEFFNAFQATPKGGGTIVQGQSAVNPHSLDTNIDGQRTFTASSIESNLAAAGATPGQVQSLSAAARANAGKGPGGAPAAYTGVQQGAAGLPPPTQPTTAQTQPGAQQGQIDTGAQQLLGQLTRNLTPGMNGEDVRSLQQWLINQGYNIPSGATGHYGNETMSAVSAWQQKSGIDTGGNPGYFGPRSRSFLQTQGRPTSPIGGTGLQTGTEGTFDTSGAMDLLKQYGVNFDPGILQGSPSKSFETIYEDLIKRMGLDSLRGDIENITKDIEKIDNELGDKISEVNENPWLSEALRTKRVASLQDKYAGRRDSLVNRLRLMESTYERDREEARFVAQTAMNAFYKERDFAQDQFEFLSERAEKMSEAKKKATEYNSAEYKEIQGGLYHVPTGKWIVQPKLPAGTSLKKEPINPADIYSLGLPKELTGKTEEQVYYELLQPNPPSWFAKYIGDSMGMSLLPGAVSKEWEEFRRQALTKEGRSVLSNAANATNSGNLDFGSLALPEPVQ